MIQDVSGNLEMREKFLKLEESKLYPRAESGEVIMLPYNTLYIHRLCAHLHSFLPPHTTPQGKISAKFLIKIKRASRNDN